VWIQRDIYETVRHLVSQRPALVITGARQTGKTSLLREEFPDYGYVSLDVPAVAEAADETGEHFLQTHPPPLIVDEVQYAPKLFRHLKAAIDRRRDQNGQYVLTGSQKFSLMANVSESLAGRLSLLEVHSLSLGEIERWNGQTTDRDVILERIIQGGYPELHAKGLDPERFYSDYVATYIERDVRQVLQVKSLRDFDRFMRLCASRTGQLLSVNSLATDLGMSPTTAKTWLSVLQASNVIMLLEPYYRNLGKRLVKAPKLYFLDTGLACFLTGLRTASELGKSSMLGALFETLVAGQMVRWFSNRGRTPNLYFYRDHYGHEVDFVIPVGEKLRLFECKWAQSSTQTIAGFDELRKLTGEQNILSRTLITSERRPQLTERHGVQLDDAVDLSSLALEQ
jgi:predicted AAA+ superfamily ATPase